MYNEFSTLYDKLVFDIDYDAYAAYVRTLLKERKVTFGSLLEMACGTGQMTRRLAEDFDQVIAYDLSQEMLIEASNQLWDVENVTLLCGDMTTFILDGTQDAVLCALNAINYLQTPEALKETFANVAQMLEPEGLFVFDIDSAYKLTSVLGDNTYAYEHDGVFYTWISQYDPDESLVDSHLEFFVQTDDPDLYRRITETQTERVWTDVEMTTALETAGFEVIDRVELGSFEKINSKTHRIVYVCQMNAVKLDRTQGR